MRETGDCSVCSDLVSLALFMQTYFPFLHLCWTCATHLLVSELHWRSLDEPDRNFVLKRAVVGEVFTTDTSNGVWEEKNKLDSLTSTFWIHMEVAAHNAFKGTFLLLRTATSVPDRGNSHNQVKMRSKAFSFGRKPLWLHPPALITWIMVLPNLFLVSVVTLVVRSCLGRGMPSS
jgi:hypothetical protein